MAVYSVDEVLKIIMEWEDKLNQFYVQIEDALDDEQAKQLVHLLKKGQEKAVAIIHDIDLDEYENVEFDKNLPNLEQKNIFEAVTLNEDSHAGEILAKILNFEEELLKIFQQIHNMVVYQKSKDIFDMLIQYKLGQVKAISQYSDYY